MGRNESEKEEYEDEENKEWLSNQAYDLIADKKKEQQQYKILNLLLVLILVIILFIYVNMS